MARDATLEDLISIVEIWQQKRKGLAEKFTADGMRSFMETHNAVCRNLVSATAKQDPDFWSAWTELGVQCQTITSGAKTFVDGIDRTNV
jgi:hypothetical protein